MSINSESSTLSNHTVNFKAKIATSKVNGKGKEMEDSSADTPTKERIAVQVLWSSFQFLLSLFNRHLYPKALFSRHSNPKGKNSSTKFETKAKDGSSGISCTVLEAPDKWGRQWRPVGSTHGMMTTRQNSGCQFHFSSIALPLSEEETSVGIHLKGLANEPVIIQTLELDSEPKASGISCTAGMGETV
eukprot:Gb_20128 [translate_table: standard]